jgi:aspartate-semialdehyde dehydrogenase
LKVYNLPSSPKQVINYLGDDIYPNPIEHVNNQNGMEFTCGAMKYDPQTGKCQITGLIHNLVRGAAGGAILTAELMIALGIIKNRVD